MAKGLGARLQAVANYVPFGARLGDIGTDHAYLPIALYEQGIINRAVGIDVHRGPYESAIKAVKERKLEDHISIRLGNGLIPLQDNEVDVLTIAGMGGRTILEILQSKPEIAEQIKTLIIQPQGAEGAVRLELLQSGWRLMDEQLVEEDGRIYVVIAFEREKGWDYHSLKKEESFWYKKIVSRLPQLEEKGMNEQVCSIFKKLYWQIGPVILRKADRLLEIQLNDLINMLNKQIREMKKTDREEVRGKIKTIELQIMIIQEIQYWVFKEKCV